jgi:putative oxidoreductase
MTDATERVRDLGLLALRVVAGTAYFVHGIQKSIGALGGFDGQGNPADLMSKYGAAGVIETILGPLIIFGFYTRAAAFIAAGEMAVAYFWVHVAAGGLFWWNNRGEVVLLNCFIFLFFAAWGAGPLSVDGMMAKRRAASSVGAPPRL